MLSSTLVPTIVTIGHYKYQRLCRFLFMSGHRCRCLNFLSLNGIAIATPSLFVFFLIFFYGFHFVFTATFSLFPLNVNDLSNFGCPWSNVIYEEEAPCLTSQSTHSLPWRMVWWKLTFQSRCCSWTILLIRGAWGWWGWTSDTMRSRATLKSDSRIMFMFPASYTIRKSWKMTYNSGVKQEVK